MVRMGKGSSISPVSTSLSHGVETKVDELDGQVQMLWNQPSTKGHILFEHGMDNSIHIGFLDQS